MLLRQYPDGLREQEIAETLHLGRRTTNNYLNLLEAQSKVYKESDGLWYVFPYQRVARSLALEPEQAAMLYLALRLFVKHSDKRVETAETLLLQFASILNEDLGLSDDLSRAARELSQRPHTANYEDILRTILRAYIYKRPVQIIYHPYRGEAFETILSPYLIEPSGIGFANYVIGHSSIVDGIRTHKIERIEHARILLHREYTIPADFPGADLLRNAFSIYYGEDVKRILLRFHPSVARRVQETNWRTAGQPEWDSENPGYLLLTFEVADTTDLKPWIRTWGANCEVLEPQILREEVIGEARRTAELYGWHVTRHASSSEEDDLGLTDTLNDFFG